jgi:hypothetical protein
LRPLELAMRATRRQTSQARRDGAAGLRTV